MAFKRDPDAGRQAVVWLATAFVVVIGAASTALIILGVSEQPTTPLIVWGSLFGGMGLFLGYLAIPKEGGKGKNWLQMLMSSRDKTDTTQIYRIARKRAEMKPGTNGPPTLESVREAAEQGASVRWVPHGSVPDRTSHDEDR